MESIIYGIPIVSSNIPSSRDLFINNKNGFLCEVEDVDCYCSKIMKILQKKELSEYLIGIKILKDLKNYITN